MNNNEFIPVTFCEQCAMNRGLGPSLILDNQNDRCVDCGNMTDAQYRLWSE